MPSLRQFLERIGLSGGSSTRAASDMLKKIQQTAAEEGKRTRKEIEKLRKKLEQRFGELGDSNDTATPGKMAGLLRHLHERGPRIETIIDIGASDSQWSKMAMQYFPQHRYLMVEAQPVHEAALKAFASDHPNVQVVMAAAGHESGDIHFDASDPYSGQASPTPYAENDIVVPVTTLDAEVTTRVLPGPFLIKFDTHGFEVPILEGASQMLAQTNAIIMECYNFKISPDCLFFHEMCAFLATKGFRCAGMADVLHRERDGLLWQMDILFLRADQPEFAHNNYR